MKWGTQEWLIRLTLLSRNLSAAEQQPPKSKRDRHEHTPAERTQTVVGGEISRDPVNRQAALMLARNTDWLSAEPPAHPKFNSANKPRAKEKKPNKKKKRMSNKAIATTMLNNESQFPTGRDHRLPADANPEDYFNMDRVAARVIDTIRSQQPKDLSDLARAALDARKLVQENLRELVDGMEAFSARVKVALDDVRQSRFAFVTETAQMVKPLRDIREFFIDKNYETEVARLKDFVELCERLERLKKNGTLDAIGDTMIKLSVS